jgi:hypothetical protein
LVAQVDDERAGDDMVADPVGLAANRGVLRGGCHPDNEAMP